MSEQNRTSGLEPDIEALLASEHDLDSPPDGAKARVLERLGAVVPPPSSSGSEGLSGPGALPFALKILGTLITTVSIGGAVLQLTQRPPQLAPTIVEGTLTSASVPTGEMFIFEHPKMATAVAPSSPSRLSMGAARTIPSDIAAKSAILDRARTALRDGEPQLALTIVH